MAKANTHRTIKAIFQKKYWDGSDAGRILLYNMARARDQQMKGKEPTPVYPPEKFNAIVEALPAAEALRYRMYDAIGDIIGRFTAGYGLYRMNLFYDLQLYQALIETVRAKDEATQDEAAAPVIMTQKQYDREYTEARRAYKATTVNYFELLMLEVKRALKRKTEGVLFAPVLDELEPLRSEKATDKIMLAQYNRLSDSGYYVIPGTQIRSDDTDPGTWDAAVKANTDKLITRILKLEQGLRTVPQDPDAALAKIGWQRKYKGMEYIYRGGEAILEALRETIPGRKATDYKGRAVTPAEAEYVAAKVTDQLPAMANRIANAQEHTLPGPDKLLVEDIGNLIIYGGSAPVRHYYEDVPADVNKYDLLLKGIDLYATAEGDFFYGSEAGRIAAFKKEYPRLYEAALREVEYKRGIPADGKPLNEMTVRWGLMNRTVRIPDEVQALYDQRKPELLKEIDRRGIAILDGTQTNKDLIDKRGNYKARTAQYKQLREMLRQLDTGIADTPQDIITQNIAPDAAGYFAYSAMIEVIADVVNVPLLTVFKPEPDDLYEAARDVNKRIYTLIYGTYAGKQEDAARREDFRKQIRKIFIPVNLDQYCAIPAETEPIKDQITKFITPPHIYKGNRVLPTATAKQLAIGYWHMVYKLRDTITERTKANE